MNVAFLALIALICGLACGANAAEESWTDASLHKVTFVPVDSKVALQVLDWGGCGRDVVLLAELGHTAHTFDDFAPKLASAFRVIGITRRGYFPSDSPDSGYEPERLAADIAQVIDRLNLKAPVLIGHSIAQGEMNAFASRFPTRAAGFVFLDGPYDRTDAAMLAMRPLDRKIAPTPPTAADLVDFASTSRWLKSVRGVKLPDAEERLCCEWDSDGKFVRFRSNASPASGKILGLLKAPRYADIRVPALALFRRLRSPQDFDGYRMQDEVAFQAMLDAWEPFWLTQVEHFRTQVVQGKVIELPGANHHVYVSDEKHVLREITDFIQSLGRPPLGRPNTVCAARN